MTYRELLERFLQVAGRDRQPLQCTLSLTHQCNLRCVHCYLEGSRATDEIVTAEWMRILDQAAQVGCLFVALTGGEPLLRRDFKRIYRHAKGLGFLVTVMTNGTRIDESILDLFEEWPPHTVDVSIYAWDPTTYRRITGRDVGPAVYGAVAALAARKIRVTTKTMVMRENLSELESIQAWAQQKGLHHRTDASICPTYGGSRVPLEHRIADQAVVELERQSSGWAMWSSVRDTGSNGRFRCGAGRRSFQVNPDGSVSLCLFDPPVAGPGHDDLGAIWTGALYRRREQTLPDDHPCAVCELRPFCDACPPLLRMEGGSEDRASSSRCVMAGYRARALGRDRTTEGSP